MSMRSSNVQTWNAWPGLESPRWNLATLLAILVAGERWPRAGISPRSSPVCSSARRGGDISGPFSRVSFHRSCPAFLRLLIVPTIETIQISIMGTTLAIMLGFPLALLATDRLCFAGVVYEMDGDSSRWRRLSRRSLYLAARMLLNLCRSIPDVVWALMFVRVVGLGPFPGVLAIGVSYGGMLGKIYAEISRTVLRGPLRRCTPRGPANRRSWSTGFCPRCLPTWSPIVCIAGNAPSARRPFSGWLAPEGWDSKSSCPCACFSITRPVPF